MKNKELMANANYICQKIEKRGYQALITGGAVRDMILGLEPHDIDMATNMPINKLNQLFQTYNIGKSKDFGIVTIKQGGFQFEVAQFRKNGSYSDGRRPDDTKPVSSFVEDAARRDFTINAIGLTQDGKILDYYGGKADLKSQILRTVGDPNKRFMEDKLRIIRLARFAAKLEFTIEPNTSRVAKSLAKTIHSLAVERIKDELYKAGKLGGKKFAAYIRILDKLKILQEILPEVAALKFKPETFKNHPESSNTFGHLLKALESAENVTPLELIAILFHDVGKGITYNIGKNSGQHTYYNHDKVGGKLVQDLAKRLKFSSKEIELLVFCCENHMRFHRIMEMKPTKIAKLAANNNFQALVVVCKADSLGRRDCKPLLERVAEVKASDSNKLVSKLVTGNLVMKLLNLKPGKEVGRIKRIVSEMILDQNITDQKIVNNLILEIG